MDDKREWFVRGLIALASICAGVVAEHRMQGQRIDKLDVQLLTVTKALERMERSIERLEERKQH